MPEYHVYFCNDFNQQRILTLFSMNDVAVMMEARLKLPHRKIDKILRLSLPPFAAPEDAQPIQVFEAEKEKPDAPLQNPIG